MRTPCRATSASGLETLLRIGGSVATLAGLHAALAGARSVPGYARGADARLESELRFYGIFYSAYGIELWRAAADADRHPRRVRELAAVLLAAGAARATGWRTSGRPSPHQVGLLALELAAPPLVVAWPRVAGRASRARRRS